MKYGKWDTFIGVVSWQSSRAAVAEAGRHGAQNERVGCVSTSWRESQGFIPTGKAKIPLSLTQRR